DHGIMTYAGYIVGFPADSPESVAEDIATMQRELPLDLAEFFILTPLPGSEDHKTLFDRGVPMDPDMNNYDVTHVTTAHAKMSADELARTYRDAWRQYYTNEHIARILRRAEIHKVPEIFDQIIWFAGGMTIEGVHPLELGYFRRKVRTQRRHGLPHEARLPFYSRRVWDTLATHGRWFSLAARVGWLRWRVRREIAWPAKKKSTVNIAPQLVRS
ncbi:MAG: radical SAM protein, partial [Pseudomonadota bacterium]